MAGYLGSGGGYYGYHPTYPNNTPNPGVPAPAPAPAPAAPSPASGAGGAPAGSAAAQAAGGPAPWVYLDPVWQATQAGLGRDQQLAQQTLAYGRNQIEQQYGFSDTSNPFSQAAMLTRAYQQNTARTTNSAGNDLYSSSYQRNQDSNRYNYEQQTDAARRAYQDALFANTQAGQQAQNTYTTGTQVGSAQSIHDMPKAGEDGGPPIPPGVGEPGGPPIPAAPANQYVRGEAGTPTNNTAVALLGPRGATSAQGLGGGAWRVTFGPGDVRDIRIVNGNVELAVGHEWKLWFHY